MFSSLIQSILNLVQGLGYPGIFLAMVIESSIIPLPSEVILIPAGALIARGDMAFFPILISSIFGSILGALINYYLAFFLGRKTIDLLIKKYGFFLFLNKKSLQKTENYFSNHGEITTFLGRLLPVVRHLISLPAGFAKMNLSKFIIFTALGAGVWTCVLLATGYLLGSTINLWVKLIVLAIILALATIILIIYWIKNKSK
jgi:membrane protein DedA with SNARE-associated domain